MTRIEREEIDINGVRRTITRLVASNIKSKAQRIFEAADKEKAAQELADRLAAEYEERRATR